MKQGWEIKKLGEVCDILDSQRKPVTKKDRKEGQYPYYGATGIQDYVDSYIFDGRYLLLGEDGAKWGAMDKSAFIIEGKCWVNNHAHILKVHDCLIDTFAEYYLVFKDLDEYITGAIVRKLTQQALRDIPMLVPPIAEQEKIVAELDCLSEIIEKKKQQLKELDNLAQSIFYEMFGDPVENDKGWDIVTLDDVFEIGSSKRVFESQWTDSGVPFYRAREIVKLSKSENIDSPIFISEELYHEYSRKYGVPAEGDMMVTAVGTLGVCYLVKNTDRFYFKDGNTLWFKSRGLCETRFIKDEFATDFIVNQIKGNANAAVVGTYTITNAKKTRVILPPLSLQQEYVRKVQHIDKQKELIAQSIKETETLFNSSMDYYFN